jgi:predicted Zn finger-like uncharacterized protein
MYTRCPECQTAFNVTIAQLKVRDGLVRCGRCDSVFRADLRLFAPPTKVRRRKAKKAEEETPLTIELDDTDMAEAPAQERPREIPVVSDLSIFQVPRRGPPGVVWALGILLAAALLIGQFAYFYRNELAQAPELRPRLAQFCAIVRCHLAPVAAALVPELLQTRISPHPRYANALRLRASFINRSERVLTLPLMQVSLTDSNGKLLARRTFTPPEYLDARVTATLAPDVSIDTLLEVTNPDGKAAGYEVQLFPQQATRVN